MDTAALEQWLRAVTQKQVRLIVTENRSLLLSCKAQPNGELAVRAHRMFLSAPNRVQQALADWLQRRRYARRVIREFIHSQTKQLQSELPLFGAKPRKVRLHSRGRMYDLAEMRDAVNRQYFDGKFACGITWGRHLRCRARRHFTFGTYSHTQNLVRIHPQLDSAEVPRFFVEFIVYHEMLHAARGQEGERNGRRIIHSKEFRADERKFAHYKEAMEWEKMNLHRFLSSARGRNGWF
jgi:hypothetical protein